MAFKLIWSPTAKLDLKDIAAFIAEDSSTVAERFIGSLFHAVERLADFQESGRIVPEFNDPAIREVIRKPCRIVYRVQRGKHIIEIARICHGARGKPDI
jgi:plasmid stabilization system protein ParE